MRGFVGEMKSKCGGEGRRGEGGGVKEEGGRRRGEGGWVREGSEG